MVDIPAPFMFFLLNETGCFCSLDARIVGACRPTGAE
jgi:hypothetical protein